MRKILSGFLATAMVASIGATMTFAVNTSASFDVDIDDTFDLVLGSTTDDAVTLKRLDVVIKINGTEQAKQSFNINKRLANGDTAADLAAAMGGLTWNNIELEKKRYDLTIDYVGQGVDGANVDLIGRFSPAAALPDNTTVELVAHMDFKEDATQDIYTTGMIFAGGSWVGGPLVANGTTTLKTGVYRPAMNLGSGGNTADIQISDSMDGYIDVEDIIECDAQGNPIVLTEDPEGVDKDQNSADGVQSSKTVYFMLKKGSYNFDDDTYWKLKLTKGDNGKYVKKLSDVSKNFGKDLYNVKNGDTVPGTGGARHRYVKVELNEIYTDDEYKITLDMRLTPKSKAVDVYPTIVSDSDEFKVKDFYFYMKNEVKDADNDWKVGINGLMLNPLENDWNDVTWFDEDGDVAHMKFFADSDVGKFYSKLSTKWEHADYASYFNDQDAFIFNFTGSPKLSSTSRADLEIYNPFVDEDGNETIDPATAVVYQVIDGDLYDVTDSFEYKEGENGDMAFCTRTRFLGTYIICEKAVEEAVADETVPDELTPDTTEAPEDVTPDSNAGGKQPANTGKYL